VDAVLPGVSRENAPATWIDGSPARGAAVGERIATVGAMATFQGVFHSGGSMKSIKWLLYNGKSENNMDDSMGTP
jgi:hypothetical protein